MPRNVVDLTASSPPPSSSTDFRLLADPVLKSAIDTASRAELRQTLRAVCSSSMTASATARSLLSPPEGTRDEEENDTSTDSASEEDDEEAEEEEEEELGTNRSARVPVAVAATRRRPRHAVCKRCLEDFDANSAGRDDECVSHPGTKEADWKSDVWCDWDEDCHGNIEDQGDEYPAGFIYTCCGGPGDSDGCCAGRHKEYVGGGRPYKRVRY